MTVAPPGELTGGAVTADYPSVNQNLKRLFWPVTVAESPVHGLGVFATRLLPRGKIVEECHALPVTSDEWEAISGTRLARFMYEWPDGGAALALGCGSLYNHSDRPNAEYWADPARKMIVIRATRTIRCGEEIFIDYGAAAPDPGVDGPEVNGAEP